MKRALVVILASLWTLSAHPSLACTNVVVVGDDSVLAANNLDTAPPPRVWFVPGGDGRHGRMCFGTDKEFKIAEGGVNERGLFIAVNAIGKTGWTPDPELPSWEEWSGWYGTGVPDGILANCTTVDEAVAVFRAYNLLTLEHVKFLVADRSGASAIVEWGPGQLNVIRRQGPGHLVSTNSLSAQLAAGTVSCERYRIAEQVLGQSKGEPTVPLIRRLLSATHLEGWTPTIFSAVYDLVGGRVTLYYFHNFEEPLSFDLAERLASGSSQHLLADLFEVRPFIRTVYE